MRKVISYQILSAPTIETLAIEVRKFINHATDFTDWEPCGGIAWADGLYLQAMVYLA